MTQTSPKTPRRWVILLLIASLAVNLLVAGVIIGSALSPEHRRSGEHDGGPARGFIGEPFLKALSDADRRKLVRELRQNEKTIRESRDGLRQRFEEFLTVVRAESFDAKAAVQLLGSQRELVIGRQKHGEQLLMQRLEAMTPQERTAYADRLAKMLKHLRRRRD